ncbi:histidine phosphatase superfamily protein (branch 1) [Pseudonocardia hierapolitana]|uniref:Histidine phosphatase superfamily protein (Branch 1) n=1 Tax=Pseudonocardia hierapolitana TaxID=1128676 RepID=A0A561SP61_9PSEU|nr:phosphoglycerate mutase family protein [Pseudonocardia hierapolitana]TWF76644.1 histidine phosphatase superfamily protein (branch 1) [Pseudonocardia hierapolitana]
MRPMARLSRWCFLLGRCTPAVILIRHADVAGGGADPALSAAGSARALELRHVFHDAGLDSIYITRWQRTQQTAAPLAADLGVTPVQIDSAVDVITAIRARPPSSAALVVGHTNTVPDIIAGLGGPTGVTIGATEFDRLFVLLRGRLIQLHYGP